MCAAYIFSSGVSRIPFATIVPISVGKDKDMARACDAIGPSRHLPSCSNSVASLIGHSGSSAFRLSTAVVVDVSRGLALLFGLGTKALPSWESRTRWNNLTGGLAVRGTAGPSDQANSPHPSSREGHHSTARWSSSFLLSDVILYGFMLLRPVPWSSGTRCRQPRCGA